MIRVAMVGLGEIGRGAHLPAILRNERVSLVAVADASPQARSAVRELAPTVTVRSSLDEVLTHDEVDAVVLATPPWVTPQLSVAALRAGLYVLAEKPIATGSAELSAYDPLTPSQLSRFQLGLTYRHHPAIIELRRLIRDAELGEELLVRAHIYDEARTDDAAHSALIERTLAHGSPVLHEGAHVFDWLDFLLGARPTIADAWALSTAPGLAAPNLTGARLVYPHAMVLVEIGWFTEHLPTFAIEVVGDRGLARLEGVDFTLTVTVGSSTPTVWEPTADRTALSFDLQLDRFADLIDGVTAHPSPDFCAGVDALRTSEAVVARATASRVGEGARA